MNRITCSCGSERLYDPKWGSSWTCVECGKDYCGTSKSPPGWFCTRPHHEDGPCAALPICEHDNFVFHRPLAVRCPCWSHGQAEDYHWGCCKGTLRSDGRNTMDSLTFLQCDTCACVYVAEDLKKERTDAEAVKEEPAPGDDAGSDPPHPPEGE